ncbi:diguanylate cyclase [Motiliproteus sp. SC1-56]|uniref:sensor domain-containing diguanylate cyclase n=1 Tax=Motiliproteus sp. SC1-56 TaxID=2799565 RepID=UPI001A8F25B4|nr:diguanylate cyclase [Motiliproteus sp. SC1-56]
MFRHIDLKVLVVIGTVVGIGLASLVGFYSEREERDVLAQNKRTLLKLVDSTRQGLKTLMLSGYGDVGPVFAKSLDEVPGVVDLAVVRPDGSEAFADNRTIDRVNQAVGYEMFYPREQENPRERLQNHRNQLREVLSSGKLAEYYDERGDGERLYTLLSPIFSEPVCQECHPAAEQVLGVIKLTTSLARVDADIALSRLQSLLLLAVILLLIVAVIRLFVVKNLVRPLGGITQALRQVSQGDFLQQLSRPPHAELSMMVDSFNQMTQRLAGIYSGLQAERNKLTTIILGAREGMVATDERGQVVLVNPAAEQLLGKSAAQISEGGLSTLFDDPEWIDGRLAAARSQVPEAAVIEYNRRTLSVQLATIWDDIGRTLGSAALIRDITEETVLQARLEHESRTDPLTGLYNRRYFDQQLEQELRLARRYQRDLALVIFDVDHFKQFNDRHGHDQGDRILCEVAARVREGLRSVDVFCRYGGEEFVIIMPGIGIVEAKAGAEQLRASIAGLDVDGLSVTASFGVSAGQGEARALLEAADRALYQAKGEGRNRVFTANPE